MVSGVTRRIRTWSKIVFFDLAPKLTMNSNLNREVFFLSVIFRIEQRQLFIVHHYDYQFSWRIMVYARSRGAITSWWRLSCAPKQLEHGRHDNEGKFLPSFS